MPANHAIDPMILATDWRVVGSLGGRTPAAGNGYQHIALRGRVKPQAFTQSGGPLGGGLPRAAVDLVFTYGGGPGAFERSIAADTRGNVVVEVAR